MSRSWGPEDTIQVAILEWLAAELPRAIVYHIPNGGFRSLETARKLKRLGVMPGVPDLAVLLPGGRTIYIEVKAPKGVLSNAQLAFMSNADVLGHRVIVARCIEDVSTALGTLGVAA